jgi:hypothetical protein
LRAGTVNVNDGFGAAYASIDAPAWLPKERVAAAMRLSGDVLRRTRLR